MYKQKNHSRAFEWFFGRLWWILWFVGGWCLCFQTQIFKKREFVFGV